MGLIENIRAEAKGNMTKIQTSEEAKLEKIFNNMFYCEKKPNEEIEFIQQVMTRGLATQERTGLHASALIVPDSEFCLRAQVLSLDYKQLQGEQISPGLKRIFEEGNAIHEKWQRLFLRAGYAKPEDLDFTQFNNKYRISYTPDLIVHIPKFCKEKMIGEIKSVNTHQFKKMKRHPKAYKQLQWYLFLTGYKKGFVLCDDKNSQEFKIELYDYDYEIVKPFIERAKLIKKSYIKLHKENKIVCRPKDATSPICKRCSNCAMKDACWNIGNGRILI